MSERVREKERENKLFLALLKGRGIGDTEGKERGGDGQKGRKGRRSERWEEGG